MLIQKKYVIDTNFPERMYLNLNDTKYKEVLKELKSKKKKYSMAEKRIWYGMLKHHASTKGYKEGWVSHKFKEKTGVWPNSFRNTEPIEPDQIFKNYITHLLRLFRMTRISKMQKTCCYLSLRKLKLTPAK